MDGDEFINFSIQDKRNNLYVFSLQLLCQNT